MNAQLETIERELVEAEERLHRLATRVPSEQWNRQPDPRRWSVAQCVEHLNITSESFLPLIRAAIEQGGSRRTTEEQRFRRDPLGWFLSVVMPPPVRFMKVRTAPSFVPDSELWPQGVIRRFEELQGEVKKCLADADGLPLNELRVTSPFDARGRAQYNLYSCFVILPRHQHRHLWQAEQVAAGLGAA